MSYVWLNCTIYDAYHHFASESRLGVISCLGLVLLFVYRKALGITLFLIYIN